MNLRQNQKLFVISGIWSRTLQNRTALSKLKWNKGARLGIKWEPDWIRFFNQIDFPLARIALERFFFLDGSGRVLKSVEPYESPDLVFGGVLGALAFCVVLHSAGQIACYANI